MMMMSAMIPSRILVPRPHPFFSLMSTVWGTGCGAGSTGLTVSSAIVITMGKWGERKYISCGMNKHGIPDVREDCQGADITTVISGLFSLLDGNFLQNLKQRE